MNILVSILSLVLFGVMGLAVWAGSEVPLIWREIALNTRKTAQGSDYKMVQILAIIIKVFAGLIWLLGIIGAIGGNSLLESMF